MKLIHAGDTPSKTVDPGWYTGFVWTTALPVGESTPPLNPSLATRSSLNHVTVKGTTNG